MLLILSSIALAAWAYLALFRGKFWKATERLLPAPAPSAWPEIVAVIPARNESETIKAAITSHMKSDYPGTFTVVLADDGSEDGTADKARMAPALRPLEIIASPSLAPGWTGKLSAVNAGIERASLTHPEARYWLLTDADIVHAPSTLRRLVAKAEQDELVLVSLMARLDARGFWGGLLIPAFVYFFQKLYPFPLVNDASRPIAAAAGGCMLVRRNALTDAGGIEAISNALIDDCALAAQLKRQGPIWLGIADDEVESLRDNRSLASIWKMVERSAFKQLDHSWLNLVGTVAGMLLLYAVPPLIALSYPWHAQEAAGVVALAAWMIMATTYLPTTRLYGKPKAAAFLLPAAGVIYCAMTVSSAWKHLRGRGGAWKGRIYPQNAR